MDKEAEHLKKEYIFLSRLIQRHTSNQLPRHLQRTPRGALKSPDQHKVVESSTPTRPYSTVKPSKNLVYRPVNKALATKADQPSGHGSSILGPSPSAPPSVNDLVAPLSPHKTPPSKARRKLSLTVAKSRYKLQKVHSMSISPPQQVATVRMSPKGTSTKHHNALSCVAASSKASGSGQYTYHRSSTVAASSPASRLPTRSPQNTVSKYKLVRSNPKTPLSRSSETNLACLGARRIVRKYKVNNVDHPSRTSSVCSRPDANKAVGQKQKNFWNTSYRNTHYYRGQKRHSASESRTGVHPSWPHLIKVGSITYKASKTKLLRTHRQSPSKYPKSSNDTPIRAKLLVVRGVTYSLDPSGKTLKRIVQQPAKCSTPLKRIDVGGRTYIERTPGTLCESPSAETRTFLSRAINRSLYHVRNAVHRKYDRRTTQYCMFFNRFGRCNRGERCIYIHDPEKVAVCTRFLRGTCRVSECPFSHRVSPDKMPVCSFFLRGCCTMESCPYRHVKVNPAAEVCRDFVRGYCSEGTRCKKQHILICPEFTATKQCSKGKQCLLTHRTRPVKRRISELKCQADASTCQPPQTTHVCTLAKQARKEDMPSESQDPVGSSTARRKLPSQPQYISLKEYESPEPIGPSASAQNKGTSSFKSGGIRIRPNFLP